MTPDEGPRFDQTVRIRQWVQVRQKGKHLAFKHPPKLLVVTVPGHPGDDLPTGTLKSICIFTGPTVEATKISIREAIELHLEAMAEVGENRFQSPPASRARLKLRQPESYCLNGHPY
jgi:predicted RNA binding protein YcfA (HicA-like mRNA interferase family)